MRGITNHDDFYAALEYEGFLCADYRDYALSTPLNVNAELKRLPNADLNVCFAFLTMLLNENFFNNTAWDKLIKDGTVSAVLDRITEIIQH